MEMTRANLTGLARTLRAAYGEKRLAANGDPLAELILTVLSQATNDRNRDRAYAALRAAFATWEEVAAAPVEEVARAIGVGGLARNKAPRIQAIIRAVGSSEALRRELAARPVAEALDYLCRLPGVGPKTAACTLLFALGAPTFPVDTHIRRIARRLGLVPAGADAVKTQAAFNRILTDPARPGDVMPASELYELHLNLLEHGRSVCRPARPRCGECPLAADCAHAQRAEGGEGPDEAGQDGPGRERGSSAGARVERRAGRSRR